MPKHVYTANIDWTCQGDYPANAYSRAHTWRFDGGVEVPASASPTVVPLPYSVEAAVDPEEAFIAAISSCHMLWFLDLARQAGMSVLSYCDEAKGEMSRLARGKMAITKVELQPEVSLVESPGLTAETLNSLHEKAHELCFIANSVNCEIALNPKPFRLA